MTASLVIPAYNEDRRIEHCVREVANWARGRPGGLDWEVILVDDGSTDGTAKKAAELASRERLALRVVSYSPNRGKGAAIVVGPWAPRHAQANRSRRVQSRLPSIVHSRPYDFGHHPV